MAQASGKENLLNGINNVHIKVSRNILLLKHT